MTWCIYILATNFPQLRYMSKNTIISIGDSGKNKSFSILHKIYYFYGAGSFLRS